MVGVTDAAIRDVIGVELQPQNTLKTWQDYCLLVHYSYGCSLHYSVCVASIMHTVILYSMGCILLIITTTTRNWKPL